MESYISIIISLERFFLTSDFIDRAREYGYSSLDKKRANQVLKQHCGLKATSGDGENHCWDRLKPAKKPPVRNYIGMNRR